MCAAGHMIQHMRKKDDDETKGDLTFPYAKGVHYTIYIYIYISFKLLTALLSSFLTGHGGKTSSLPTTYILLAFENYY